MKRAWLSLSFILSLAILSACQPGAGPTPPASGKALSVLATETFLADIAQNVAGDRLQVGALLPLNVDPHSFEPTPSDVVKVAQSDVLIINGGGVESYLEKLLQNAGGQRRIITASDGLTSRKPAAGEGTAQEHQSQGGETDPHFWLDPNEVAQYVNNIRDGLSAADPEGASIYSANAGKYNSQLGELDGWIKEQVKQIPPERRLLVTNHESLGYFADRYGFKIIGAIIPSVSTESSPSAQQMQALVEKIKQSGAPAVFLETGTNPQLADQLARETGIKVITGLYTHSVTAPGGEAPTYIEMIKADVRMIVAALK